MAVTKICRARGEVNSVISGFPALIAGQGPSHKAEDGETELTGRGKITLSHLACLIAQLLRCGKGYIDWLCVPYRALNLGNHAVEFWHNLNFPRRSLRVL